MSYRRNVRNIGEMSVIEISVDQMSYYRLLRGEGDGVQLPTQGVVLPPLPPKYAAAPELEIS